MPTILLLGKPPPRFARIRFGSIARETLLGFRGGRPLPRKDHSLSARVYVKDGTSPPLGDCPISDEGVVFSAHACDVLASVLNEFERVPVVFHGLGAEKRSGIWYKHPLDHYDDHAELEQPFYFLHPLITRLPGHSTPTLAPSYPGDDPSGEVDLGELSKWMASEVHFQHNLESYFQEYFSDAKPPPIFAFGNSAAIFFTDQFRAAVKEAGLRGFTFAEVARV